MRRFAPRQYGYGLAARTRFFPVWIAGAYAGGLEEAGFADAAAIPSARTGTWPTRTVTSNPFLAAPSARAPYSPPNRVLRRLAYGLISPLSTRFQAPTGELVVPMPAIIGSGARPS